MPSPWYPCASDTKFEILVRNNFWFSRYSRLKFFRKNFKPGATNGRVALLFRSCFTLKYQTLYQEHMNIEEMTRPGTTSSSSPNIYQKLFEKKFKRGNLETRKYLITEISKFVSEAHEDGGGATIWPPVEQISWYRGYSKKIQAGIF